MSLIPPFLCLQEISKLRSLVNRQKSDVEQLKSKLPGASRRRFDPSKAFQHNSANKENEANEALREGENRADLSTRTAATLGKGQIFWGVLHGSQFG